MIIRPATLQDNEKLITLTSLTPMPGIISLRIDRNPDFFALLTMRGKYIVLVAESENQIIGCISCSVQNAVINHKTYPVYYLGDLKVHPAHAGTTTAYRLLKAMSAELKSIGADLLFCATAAGNKAVQALLAGRAGFQHFEKMGTFKVHQLLPKKSGSGSPYIKIINSSPEVISFYQDYYSRYSFYPVMQNEKDCLNYVWKEMNEIKAAATVYDPSPLKQNVVIDYPLITGLLLKILGGLKRMLLLPELPRKGRALRILYVRYYAYRPGEEKIFQAVMKKIRNDAFLNGFHFVSFTVHEKDSTIEKLIRSKRTFTFRSLGFNTSLKNNVPILKQINAGIPFEDYSLI